MECNKRTDEKKEKENHHHNFHGYFFRFCAVQRRVWTTRVKEREKIDAVFVHSLCIAISIFKQNVRSNLIATSKWMHEFQKDRHDTHTQKKNQLTTTTATPTNDNEKDIKRNNTATIITKSAHAHTHTLRLYLCCNLVLNEWNRRERMIWEWEIETKTGIGKGHLWRQRLCCRHSTQILYEQYCHLSATG